MIMVLLFSIIVIGLDRGELAERDDDNIRQNLNISYAHRTIDTDNINFYFKIHDFRYQNNRYIEGYTYIITTLEKIEVRLCINQLGRNCYERIINSYEPLDLIIDEENNITVIPIKAQLLTQARATYNEQRRLRDEAARDARIINNFLDDGLPEHDIDVRQE